MRCFDQGAFYRVTVSQDEVHSFASRWPCFGPRVAFSFTFDKANGDLVDIHGDTEDHDGRGVAALSEDCQKYGETRIKVGA